MSPFLNRFPSYKHLMAFWFLIEPWIHKMVSMSKAKLAAQGNEEMMISALSSKVGHGVCWKHHGLRSQRIS